MERNPEVRLAVRGITHRYGDVTALRAVDLEIHAGEFVTFLGPSGCGKTTLLRIMAGFIRPSEGHVLLEKKDVTRVPPHRRPMNMVFQRSSLFPHLNVFENIAFGLRIARVSKDDVRKRVSDALALVRLEGYELRRAHELSGGQMQRVALARALVNQPRVLLLDEPLSALDLRIRLEMEEELRRVHRETGATFVYVTHDQREALALSDRVAVFDRGQVEQIGGPEEIYQRPASPFAAGFLGDANVIPVELVGRTGDRAAVRLGSGTLSVPSGPDLVAGAAWLVVRPELVRLEHSGTALLRATVRDRAFRGSGYSFRLEVDGLGQDLKAEAAADSSTEPLAIGSEVGVSWDADACVLLPRESTSG